MTNRHFAPDRTTATGLSIHGRTMKPQSSILACLSLCALLFGCKSESPEKLNPVLPPPTPPNEWVQTSQLPGSVAVYSFAIDGDEVFVGTYGGGAFVSGDNGDSWKRISGGLQDTSVTCIATSSGGPYSQYIFAASASSLFRSTDKGANWANIKTGGAGYRSIDIIPNGSSIRDIFIGEMALWVGGISGSYTSGGGLFHSTDNGSNWDQVANGLPRSDSPLFGLTLSPTDSSIYGYDYSNVYRSTDRGFSWSSTATMQGQITSLAVSAYGSSKACVYVGTYYYGIYRSTDDGLSWSAANAGLTDTSVNCIIGKDSLLFAATSHGGVFRRMGNTSTWTAVNTGLTEFSVRVLAANGSYLFAGTNNGQVWRRLLSQIASP